MGCFWCGESEFRDHQKGVPLAGIISIRVGYAGGITAAPTYQSHPGYKESVKITFNPAIISYAKLLEIFWYNVDPLDAVGQFCDKGFAYTSAIFIENDEQKLEAMRTKKALAAMLGQPIKTEIIRATTFYDAEEYHQNYKFKNSMKYKYYRWNCGRDQRLKQLWDKKK